jgi:hypothetical protein
MNRVQWLQGGDPARMLKHLGDRASPRKLRLFGCACLRRIWDLLLRRIEDSRPLVELVERYADGRARLRDFGAWYKALPNETPKKRWEEDRHPLCAARSVASWATLKLELSVRRMNRRRTLARETAEVSAAVSDSAMCAARAVAVRLLLGKGEILSMEDEDRFLEGAIHAEMKVQADLLRCIFGTPFRSSSTKHVGLTAVIQQLALSAYEERHLSEGHLDPACLAVLADALEEGGFTNAELLTHLRGPGPHVRGCWAVDRVLGNA